MAESQNRYSRRIGKWMTFAAWIIVLALFTLFFADRLEKQRNPNQNVYSRVDNAGVQEVVLKRNRFGHYVTSGAVNGKRVEFLLDTGASDVAIPAELAAHWVCNRACRCSTRPPTVWLPPG